MDSPKPSSSTPRKKRTHRTPNSSPRSTRSTKSPSSPRSATSTPPPRSPKQLTLEQRYEDALPTQEVAQLFRNFLESTFSLENLEFVEEVIEYEKISKTNIHTLLTRACEIYDTYIDERSKRQVQKINISSKIRRPLDEAVGKIKDRALDAPPDLFLEAKNEILKLLITDCIPQFKARYAMQIKRINNKLKLPYLFWRCYEELEKREKMLPAAFSEGHKNKFDIELLATSLKDKDKTKADNLSISELTDNALISLLKYYFQSRKHPVIAPEITIFLDIIISRGQEVVDRIREILHSLPAKDQAVLHLTLRLLKRAIGTSETAAQNCEELARLFASLFFGTRRKENEDVKTVHFLITEEEQIFELALLLLSSEKANEGRFISKDMYYEKKNEWSKIYQTELQRFNFMKTSDYHLQPRDWVILSSGSQSIEFPMDGVIIVNEGSRNGYLFRVVKGECHVLKNKGGKSERIGVLLPGAFFGEMSIIVSAGEATSSIVAMKDSVVQRMSPLILFPLFDAYPDLARRFYWTAACRMANRLLLIDKLDPQVVKDNPPIGTSQMQLRALLTTERTQDQKDRAFSKQFKLTDDEIIIKDFQCASCILYISQNFICVIEPGLFKKRKVIPLSLVLQSEIDPKTNGIEIHYMKQPSERSDGRDRDRDRATTTRREAPPPEFTKSPTKSTGGLDASETPGDPKNKAPIGDRTSPRSTSPLSPRETMSSPSKGKKERTKGIKTLLVEGFPPNDLKQGLHLINTLADQRRKQSKEEKFEMVVTPVDVKQSPTVPMSSMQKKRLMLKPRESILDVVTTVQQKRQVLAKEVHMLQARDWQMIMNSQSNETVTFDRGHLILKKGKTYTYIYHIIHGSVVLKLDDQELHRVEQGNLLGTISFLQGGPATVSVFAGEDGVKLLKIDKNFLSMLFQSYPEVGHRFYSYVCINLGDHIIQRESHMARAITRQTKSKSVSSVEESLVKRPPTSSGSKRSTRSRSSGPSQKSLSGPKDDSTRSVSSRERGLALDYNNSSSTDPPQIQFSPPVRQHLGTLGRIPMQSLERGLSGSSISIAPSSPRNPPPSVDWSSMEKKFCIHCGFHGLPKIAKFCSKCGGPLPIE